VASVAELRRAMEELKFPGAMLFSNVNGVPLADERYWPLYEAADALGAVLHIHPTNPVSVEAMREYWLMPLVGFLFDTTLAAASLVFSGVLERYPSLKLCLAHGGGFVPYQYGRFDHGWQVRPEPKAKLQELPSTYIRRLYFDIITHAKPALEYLVGEFGADHVVLGTDYPYDMGVADPVGLIDSLTSTDAAGKQAIKGGNAAKLLKIHA
jgi:aminocarboxymuconate-semialdehyde decarboxylase